MSRGWYPAHVPFSMPITPLEEKVQDIKWTSSQVALAVHKISILCLPYLLSEFVYPLRAGGLSNLLLHSPLGLALDKSSFIWLEQQQRIERGLIARSEVQRRWSTKEREGRRPGERKRFANTETISWSCFFFLVLQEHIVFPGHFWVLVSRTGTHGSWTHESGLPTGWDVWAFWGSGSSGSVRLVAKARVGVWAMRPGLSTDLDL